MQQVTNDTKRKAYSPINTCVFISRFLPSMRQDSVYLSRHKCYNNHRAVIILAPCATIPNLRCCNNRKAVMFIWKYIADNQGTNDNTTEEGEAGSEITNVVKLLSSDAQFVHTFIVQWL